VEAVVDEPFAHVVDGDSALFGQRAQVNDALVRHQVVLAPVQHRIGLLQPVGEVVGRQHRRAGGLAQPLGAHQTQVGPADRQDGGRTVGCGADRSFGGPTGRVTGVSGQVVDQVLGHGHRSHTGAASAVRDAAGLVQVQVGDVAAEPSRAAPAEQCVQVGAVDVDLPAGLVHHGADLLHL